MTDHLKRRGHARGRRQPPASNLIGLAAACRILGIDKRQLARLADSLLIRPAIVERDGVRWFDVDVLRQIVEAVHQFIALQRQREEGRRRRTRAATAKTPARPDGAGGPAIAARPAAAGPPERPADRLVKADYRPPVVYSPGRNARPQATGTAPHRAAVAVPPLMTPPRGVLAPPPVRAPVPVAAPAPPPPTPTTAFDEWCNAPLPDLDDLDDLDDEDDEDDEDEGDAS